MSRFSLMIVVFMGYKETLFFFFFFAVVRTDSKIAHFFHEFLVNNKQGQH